MILRGIWRIRKFIIRDKISGWKIGLWTILATIAANIEALIVVEAFGMEMTLGNILFASTFLVTDILSELYGKKAAQHAVYLGIVTSILFIPLSSSWLLYTPGANDWAMPSIRTIFSTPTPNVCWSSCLCNCATF